MNIRETTVLIWRNFYGSNTYNTGWRNSAAPAGCFPHNKTKLSKPVAPQPDGELTQAQKGGFAARARIVDFRRATLSRAAFFRSLNFCSKFFPMIRSKHFQTPSSGKSRRKPSIR